MSKKGYSKIKGVERIYKHQNSGNYLAIKKAHLPALVKIAKDSLKQRMAERYFLMKSIRCRYQSKANYYAFQIQANVQLWVKR